MATGNFHNVNASGIYAFAQGTAFDEAEFIIEDLKAALLEADNVHDNKYVDVPTNELRSYKANDIGLHLSWEKDLDDFHMAINVFPLVRNGYYSGYNFDWTAQLVLADEEFEVEVKWNGDEVAPYVTIFHPSAHKFQEITNMGELLGYAFDTDDIDEDELMALTSGISVWFTREFKTLITQLETAFAAHSTKLKVIGHSSNGGAFYEEA